MNIGRLVKTVLSGVVVMAMLPFVPGMLPKTSAAADTLEVYVSPTGSDTGSGTLESPFLTFDKAMVYAQSHKNDGKHITVYVRGGVYRLAQTLAFTPDIWDSDTYTLTFMPYNDEKVTLSGTVPLGMPAWQPYTARPGVYAASIGTGYDFDALIANGTRQILARYPNYVFGEKLKSTVSVTDAQLAARVSAWANPAGGYIRALHTSEWGGNSYRITGKSGTSLQYTWVGDNNRGSAMHNTHRIFENIFEELDAPGEWFYDKAAGMLYFWPPDGMNLSTASFEGAALEQLVTFRGTRTLKAGKTAADEFAYNYSCVKNVTFNGITFANTHRTLFTGTFERPLRGDWGIVRKGAVYMENAEDIRLLNCAFTGLGGNAVMMSAYNRGHVVDRGDFTDVGASGVLIVGLEDAVRNPSHWDKANGTPDGGSGGDHKTAMGDTAAGPRGDDYARDITVSNCYMYNLGVVEKQTAGVCISIASGIKVLRNTIHYVPRAAINISDGTFGGHEIAYNDLFDTVRETGDHGPFNAWGRDRFWSLGGFDTNGSRGDVKAPYALCDAVEPVLVHNNRIHEINGSFGIDLDDGASNYKVYNNLLLGASIKLREGFQRDVYNNIIVKSGFEKHCTFTNNGDRYFDNIVYNGKGVNIAGGESAQQTTVFERNFYYNGDNAVSEARGNVNTARLNPQFLSPETNNFAVAVGSPVLTLTQFENFPMLNSDFGRADKPNPPALSGITGGSITPDVELRFIDYGASRAESTCISPVNESLRSAAGLPDTAGVYLLNVAPGGYFAQQGFRQGDVIRSLNGAAITGVDDLFQAFMKNYKMRDFTGVIYRNQQPLEVAFAMAEEPVVYPWMAGGVKGGSGWQVPGGRTDDEIYCGIANIAATQRQGDYYEFTFYGVGVGIQSERYTDEGRYAVYLDGEFVEEISGYHTERQRPCEIYTLTGLEPGKHVLRVENLENNWLILDGFRVFIEFDGTDEPGELLKGDVSGDGDVDSTDARMVLQYEVGLISLDEEQLRAADVSGDDAVDSTDARMILQYEVGLINW